MGTPANPPFGWSAAGEGVVLHQAAVAARRAFDARASFVSVPTADGVTITAGDGLHDPAWSNLLIRHGRGLGGRVMLERTPISLADYLVDASITGEHRPVVQREGLRAIACMPMRSASGTEALLYLASDRATAFGDRTVVAAQAIADLAGGALALARGHAPRPDDEAAPRLTPRERDVLDLLGDGASNAVIARRLVVTEATAKEHVRNLRRKLDAGSRLEAVARARAVGLL